MTFLQHYWWLLVSLLAAILVFLLFVQGANSLLFILGRTDDERRLIVNSTGRKWELTFTTLVTFGGAFFAAFPLFYSTSFGSAYWLWILILLTFVLQAVSYEFQHKLGNLLGTRVFQWALVLNGILGPLLLGGAVATFFEGSNFIVEKSNLISALPSGGHETLTVISRWANASCGLDALLNFWVVAFGIAVTLLAQSLGLLYLTNNIDNERIRVRCHRLQRITSTVFAVLLVAYLAHLFTKDGAAIDPAGIVYMEPNKYLHNALTLWPVSIMLVAGVLLFLFGALTNARRSIWFAGPGVVLVVLSLLLLAGWADTAYYPSSADLQSSLTIANSSSSETTLRTMAYVSILIPFVIAYIAYAWRKIDSRRLTLDELLSDESY